MHPTFIYTTPDKVDAFQKACPDSVVEPVLWELEGWLPSWARFCSTELDHIGEHWCSWGSKSFYWFMKSAPEAVLNWPNRPSSVD